MFKELQKKALHSIYAGQLFNINEFEIVESGSKYHLIDHGLEGSPVIFKGSKPQIKAYLEGIAHGAQARNGVFSSMF